MDGELSMENQDAVASDSARRTCLYYITTSGHGMQGVHSFFAMSFFKIVDTGTP